MRNQLFSVYLMISGVTAWGGDGHRIIAELAYSLLDTPGKDFLNSVIGSGRSALENASVWADSDAAIEAYPKSASYHFANTPYRNCGEFIMKRDCGFGRTKGNCIVTALSDAIVTAADFSSSQGDRTNSTKFIIHLVADIHQPLHLGFREDRGGTRIYLSGPENSDLHYIWDTWLVDVWRKTIPDSDGSITSAAKALRKDYDEIVKASPEKFVEPHLFSDITSDDSVRLSVAKIASETILETTCSTGYTHATSEWIGAGDRVNYAAFFAQKIDSVKHQMIRGAVRLARIIDKVAEAYYTRKFASNHQLHGLFVNLEEGDEDSFGELAIDLDTVTSKPIPSPPKKQKTKIEYNFSADDLLFLEEASVQANRASYVIDGIDFASITLLRRHGLNYITSMEFAGRKNYEPSKTFHRVVRSSRNKLNIFFFDLAVFQSDTPEVIIRALLCIAGVDPRINLTDYLNGELSLPGAISLEQETVNQDGLNLQEISRWSRIGDLWLRKCFSNLTQMDQQQQQSMTCRPNSVEYVHNRVSEMRSGGDQLVWFSVRNVAAFFSERTLKTATDTLSCLRWVQKIQSTTLKERGEVSSDPFDAFETYLIDSSIMNFIPTDSRTVHDIVAMLINRSQRINNASPYPARPSIHAELEAIQYLFNSHEQKNDILASPKRAIISGFGLFPEMSPTGKLFVWKRNSATPTN